MADISKIKTLDGTTYNIKDLSAYRKGEGIRHKNSSISQDPQYVSLIENKMTSEELQTIKAIAGVGDYFYALHLNPNYTVTCNYSGRHGSKGNFAISTLFSPSSSSTVLLDVDEIATKPFVLEIMKNSGVITATDVVNLELFTHTLGQSVARLTDYKVELYTTGSTASTGTFSWQTVYQRSNVSDSPSGLIICLNATSYAYLYFQGVRFTISGATPGSTSESAWNYNCIDLSLFRLTDQRPAFSAARAIGALDISGGEVYGATQFYGGITGNLTGNASTATNASTVNNHTVNKDVPSDAVFTDTHNKAYIIAGAFGGTRNAVTTTGSTYLNLVEEGQNRSGVKLVPGSNMEITSDTNGNVTFNTILDGLNGKRYFSVTELGLISGSTTISDVWSALPTYSTIRFPRSEISDYPINQTGYIEVVKTGPNEDVGSIMYYGRQYGTYDYRMNIVKESDDQTAHPDGVWRKISNGVIVVDFGTISSLPQTRPSSGSSSFITADHIVTHYEIGHPAALNSNLDVTTSNGSVTVIGSIRSGMSTTLKLILDLPAATIT